MKKILLGTVGLIALGLAPAVAADLPARTYTKAPAYVAAVYDWSGFYIGANAGGGWNKDKWNRVVDGLDLGSHTADGAVAGGQFGYRWQTGSWVFGLEAQGDWSDIKGSHVNQFGSTDSSKLKAFGLFTGQVGYAWNNALLYAKGGAAVTSTSWTASLPGVLPNSTNDKTRWGGTVGAGLEYGFAPNWSVGVEYDHLFIDRNNETLINSAGGSVTRRVGGDTDLVTARINYRWGGPVVAKY